MARRFVEVLGETCNVTLAARAIGRSISSVYRQREKDGGFRAAWDGALATGYSRLELMMLERALHGVEKLVVARDGTTTVMREYPDRVALTLLRMHRDTVRDAPGGESGERDDDGEACARIMARLARLREQDAREEARADGAAAHEKAAHGEAAHGEAGACDPASRDEAGALPVERKAGPDPIAWMRWGLARQRRARASGVGREGAR